jgi:hypothetical protein
MKLTLKLTVKLTVKSISLLVLLFILSSCQNPDTKPIDPPKLHQQWELQAGDRISGYEIISGLGDLSIDLGGRTVYAPFKGKTTIDTQGCVYFETPEVPNYQFRLCGLKQPHLGNVNRGDSIANADTLRFATLRKHPSGKWAIVEPSKQILETLLKPS